VIVIVSQRNGNLRLKYEDKRDEKSSSSSSLTTMHALIFGEKCPSIGQSTRSRHSRRLTNDEERNTKKCFSISSSSPRMNEKNNTSLTVGAVCIKIHFHKPHDYLLRLLKAVSVTYHIMKRLNYNLKRFLLFLHL
jgi:hypothetical protein